MSEGTSSGTLSEDGKQWWDGSAWRPVPEKDGAIILFTPTAASTTAAIFAHGVDSGDEIDPVSGVTLGYYSEHGNALDANITWASSTPTHAPQKAEGNPTGNWPSYALTTIGVPRPAELAPTANEYGIAIAYVVDTTSTKDLIPKLAGLGYTDVRGVHCRESVDTVAEPTFGAATEITQEKLVEDGWKEAGGDSITADTDLGAGDALEDASGTYFKIASVVEAKSKYTIERLGT